MDRHVERQKKPGSYLQVLTGRVSVRCLELLETVFDRVERLSRRANGPHLAATSQTLSHAAGDSQKSMKAAAN